LDIIAVRFPHDPPALSRSAARPLEVFLGVDPALASFENGVDVIIGEVKEGRARVNPALRRAETVAFALRRLGCCPESTVGREARAIASLGAGELHMLEGSRCRIRLVTFAGHGGASDSGLFTLALGHCAEFIAGRLREARDVLAGAQFKDPVLGLLTLQDKLERRGGPWSARQADRPGSASQDALSFRSGTAHPGAGH
jgi:hypothetical protein